MSAVLVAASAVVALLTSGAATAGVWTTTVDLDERQVLVPLDQVISQIERECDTSSRVTVRVTTRAGRFATTIECGVVRTLGTAAITRELVRAAASHDRTAMKADRMLALSQRLVPDVIYDRDGLIWSLATGPGHTCERAQDPAEIRRSISTVADLTHDTPEHWTLVEAVTIAVVCPRRLPALYRNVSRVGEPAAAATARGLVQQALRSL